MAEVRYPVYAEADVTVDVGGGRSRPGGRGHRRARWTHYWATEPHGMTTDRRSAAARFRPYDVVVGRGPAGRGRARGSRRSRAGGRSSSPTRRWRRSTARRCRPSLDGGGRDRRDRHRAAGRGLQILRRAGAADGPAAGGRAGPQGRGRGPGRRAWSAISPGWRRRSTCAASTSCRSRRPCWPRSIPRSAARRRSTRRAARTWSAPSISRGWCWPTSTCWPPCRRVQLRSGWAEVLKHGLICDAAFFDWLAGEGAAGATGDPAALERAVVRSVEIKSADRRRGREGGGPPRPAQPRPHLRPRHRGRAGLRRGGAGARRGGGAGLRHGLPLLGRARACAPPRTPSGSRRSSPRPACRRAWIRPAPSMPRRCSRAWPGTRRPRAAR